MDRENTVIIILFCILVMANYGISRVAYSQGYNEGYDAGCEAADICEYGWTDRTDSSNTMFQQENTAAYKAGYVDYPNSTVYDDISQYIPEYVCIDGVWMPDNATLYYFGFNDAKRAHEIQEYQDVRNNSLQVLNERLENE